MKEFIFTWNIENISYSWQKTGESIISPIFYASSMRNTAWSLALYPRGVDNSDYLSLYLHREIDNFPLDISVAYELSCLSVDSSTLYSCSIPENLTTFGKRDFGYGESRFIKRYEVFDRKSHLYLPQDILTLCCRMWQKDDDNEFGESFGRTQLTTQQIITVENIFESERGKTFHIQSKHQDYVLMSFNIAYNGGKINLKINPMKEEMKTSTCKLTFADKRTGRKLCEHISCYFIRTYPEVFQLSVLHPTENDNPSMSCLEVVTEFVYSTGEEIKSIENDRQVRIPEFISKYMICWDPSVRQTDYPNISKALLNLYNDQILCDVELKTQNKSFFAHKVVLCGNSSVFLAMFTTEMKEKINECIEIEDISTDTLDKFIIFLYTDDFKDLDWDTVVELYYVADKYQVERLNFLCCSYFLKDEDFNHVCELLIVADMHQNCELKRKVHDFIWGNEEEIFRSPMWKKFTDEQPHLAVKTMLSKYEEKGNQYSPETVDDRAANHPSLQDGIRSLYEGKIIADIFIKTKGTTFPAHKAVICAGSPTFKDALTRMSETNKGIKSIDFFEIKDMEDDAVSSMLFFLYTESLGEIQWETAKKLYQAADIYQIPRLKFMCSCFLLENLKVSNASDLLLLSHQKRDLKLKRAVEDFIHLHDDEIFGSDEWAALGEANVFLAFQTMCAKYKKD